MWRRSEGPRRRLLHGLIQVAVGYEHLKRDNPTGMSSLLRQGAAKLGRFTRRAGVREIRERALHDAERAEQETDIRMQTCPPPKVMLTLEGLSAPAPPEAVRVEIPRPKAARSSGAKGR